MRELTISVLSQLTGTPTTYHMRRAVMAVPSTGISRIGNTEEMSVGTFFESSLR